MKKYAVEFELVQHLFKNKLPPFIVQKLLLWAKKIEMIGLAETRKIPGYHDEPLTGKRIGQRSIRLNQAYRAIYIISENEHLLKVIVIEVHKHEY